MTHSNWNPNTPSMQNLQGFVTTFPYVNFNPIHPQFVYPQPNQQQIPQPPVYYNNGFANTPNFYYSTNHHQNQTTYYQTIEDKIEINEPSVRLGCPSRPHWTDLNVKEEPEPFQDTPKSQQHQIKSEPHWAELNVKEEPETFENVQIKDENYVDVKEWIDLAELAIKTEVASSNKRDFIVISDESDAENPLPSETNRASSASAAETESASVGEAETESASAVEAETESASAVEAETESASAVEAETESASAVEAETKSASAVEADTKSARAIVTKSARAIVTESVRAIVTKNARAIETKNAVGGRYGKTLYKGAPKVADVTINPDQPSLKCDYCTYTTQWENCMNRHLANNHEFIALDSEEEKEKTPEPEKSGDWKFKCDHCQYKTNWKGNMRKHVISRHKSDEEIQWFECAHCPYKGKTKEYLRFHLLSAHDKCVKWHECEHCSFRAKHKYVLKRHVVVNHTASEDIKWFQCKDCPYKGKLWEHLRNHLQIHHTKECVKKFQCEECPFKTTFKKNLKLHIIHRHTREDQIQWFTCDKCASRFKSNKLLRSHLKKCSNDPSINKQVKKGTREVPVVLGNKICFKRIPVEIPLKDRTVQVHDKSVPVKEMLCKCNNCIST